MTTLGVVIALQGFHTVEHIVQVAQFYILGRDGWLATNLPSSRLIPGLASLPRVMIHFNWNLGEMALLLLSGRSSLPALLAAGRPAARLRV